MLKLVVGIAVATACLEFIIQAYAERKKRLAAVHDSGNTSENVLIREQVRTILLNKPHSIRCMLKVLLILASTRHDVVASLRHRR